MSRISFGVWAAMALILVPLAGAQSYTITDLGTLGGAYSWAYAINDSGAVAGTADTSSGSTDAFLWTASGGMQDLGTLPGGSASYGAAVNDSGAVAGTALTSSSELHAFLWTSATGMQDLGTLGGDFSYGYGINDAGEVVGYSYFRNNFKYHAFLWTKAGGMQDLGTIGGLNSFAAAINNSGEVVGGFYPATGSSYHAFLWTQTGGMQDLGTIDGGPYSDAYAISPSGQIFGWATRKDQQKAFIWTKSEGMEWLGAGPNSNADGANSSGEVVGVFQPTGITTNTAFVKIPGEEPQNLNDLIPPNSGWVLTQAYGINQSGQIAATGTINGQIHAALLTPTN
jgi:probable HAF family extracellular repeat protein